MDQRADPSDDLWFRELIDNLGDMVCRYRPDTTIEYANRAYAEYFGIEPDRLVGRSYLDFVVEDARAAALANTQRLARLLTPDAPLAITEHASAELDGQIRWLQWSDRALFDRSDRLIGFVSTGRDVTERRLAEERIRFHANHDPLTGLANRRSVLSSLEGHVVEAGRSGQPLGVLFLDLDDFKAFNDRWGHRCGDEVLQAVAAVLCRELRTTDLAGRLGGDEFVVLCPACGTDGELDALVGRLEHALARLERPVAVSVGAVLCHGSETADEVLHRADRRMYDNKFGRRRTGDAIRRGAGQPAASDAAGSAPAA